MKKWFIVLYSIDCLSILILSGILIWWKKTHMEPGLSAMLNIKLFIAYFITAIILFIILSIVFFRIAHHN